MKYKEAKVYKRLQLDRVEGIVVGGFPGAPLADPVHGEDCDAGIALSCVLVGSKEDALRFGFCEVLFKTVQALKSMTQGTAMPPG